MNYIQITIIVGVKVHHCTISFDYLCSKQEIKTTFENFSLIINKLAKLIVLPSALICTDKH